MSKIPQAPEDIFGEITTDIKDVFGDDLVSIALYGSGAKNEYRYKKSDINFMVVLTDHGIQHLSKTFELVKKWNKRNVSVPLFLTESYINSSLDSFPIEFLNMKKHHKPVYGEEILDKLEIGHKDLRLKCEEQIKGKLLHLRKNFILTLGKKDALEEMLLITIPTFASIFTALLELQNVPVPTHKNEILIKTAEVFELDKSVFEQLLRVWNKEDKLNSEELIQLAERYIEEIRKLSLIVDQM